MIVKEEITQTVSITIDIKCNKCGNSALKKEFSPAGELYGTEVKYTTGYLSQKLPDGCRYSFHLCESCLADIISSLLIPADMEEYM